MSDGSILTRRGFFRRFAQAGAAAVVAVALPKETLGRPNLPTDYSVHFRSAAQEIMTYAPKAPYIGFTPKPPRIVVKEPMSPSAVNDGARVLERILAKAMTP